jgi:glyoxylase-like metal-dependent hydrolase (beta-lactamase superfamily II)
MLVRFWGTRGSLPVAHRAEAIQAKIARALVAASGRSFVDANEAARFAAANLPFAINGSYGGASACVEIEGGDGGFIVCDMGSGLRDFGVSAMKRCAGGHPRRYNIFLSHMHWDHIMGFPFFAPAFDPGAEIVIHGGRPCGRGARAEKAAGGNLLPGGVRLAGGEDQLPDAGARRDL